MDFLFNLVNQFSIVNSTCIENGIPVSFYVMIVLLFVGHYLFFSVFEELLGKVFVVFLEATHEMGYHLPCFFGVGLEVLLLVLLRKFKWSFTFGFSLFT
jgi:hypothetical protein